MISNKAGIQHIAELFIREGIEHIVISPGSRNAPMMLTFPEYTELKCYSIVDERSAGFFALGMALKLQKPVVLNCTSGSALLNYAPAIAEAYYQNIPLIVLSADRPAHLIDCGDGQCIRQDDVFHNFIRKSVHLPENPSSKEDILNYQKLVLEAVNHSLSPIPGPVHINVPLAEPIYDTQPKKALELITNHTTTHHTNHIEEKLRELKNLWNTSAKKLILIGQQAQDIELNQHIQKLSEREDVVIMTETTSNIATDRVIKHIDRVLSQLNNENDVALLPDLLITVGGHIVSKKIKAYLRKEIKYQHWHIGENTQINDTFFHLDKHIQHNANDILSTLSETSILSDSTYRKKWMELSDKAEVLHWEYIKKAPYSDLLVFETIRKSLEDKRINLHFSNSTPIRYSQLFKYGNNIRIDCNRGVSGIDGSVSTALGASTIQQEITCLITGELSFFYDSNALWNKYLHPGFRIIVINNGGGGIFRFIDGPMQSHHLDYFETPHQRSAKSLALENSLEYHSCENIKNLEVSLQRFFKIETKAKVLEIFTPREENDKILKSYFSFLKTSQAIE